MDLSVGIPSAYLLATGTVYTGSPGDANWIKMLTYFNIELPVWATEPGGDWESLYNSGVLAGTVTATNTFTSSTALIKPSNKAHDYVYIVQLVSVTNPGINTWISGSNYVIGSQVAYENVIYQAINNLTNDTVVPVSAPTNWEAQPPTITKIKTVPGPQLKYYTGQKNVCAISGSTINFARSFVATDPEYGGSLYVPAFTFPTLFTMSPPALTGAIPVDNPSWLLQYAAAEWAQTDVTLVQNVPSLIAKATDSMLAMKLNNQRMKTLSQETAPEGAARGDTFEGVGGEAY